jgi:hypothetical protein
MKNIYFVLCLFIASYGLAQTTGITYQAVILNPAGQAVPGVNNEVSPLVNEAICLQFALIDDQSRIEYLETVSTVTDAFGMVNLLIGTGNLT